MTGMPQRYDISALASSGILFGRAGQGGRGQTAASMRDPPGMDCDCELPDFRATVRRDGTIRLVDWCSRLATGGPLYTMLDARGRAGVAIADLIVIRDEDENATEVIVRFLCGGSPEHRQALRDWAARVGYRRAWLDGEVADLEPVPGGAVQARCSGCRARFVDAGDSLWDFVRFRGAFPGFCVLCGSDLPQWTPVCQTEPAAGDPGASENARRPACR